MPPEVRLVLNELVERSGFAIIPDVLTNLQIDTAISDLSQISSGRSKAGLRHALACTTVAHLAKEPALTTIARGILGCDPIPFRATLFDKSPDVNWLVVWHQDTALPLRQKHDLAGWGPWSIKAGIHYAHAPAQALTNVIALRVHLDDSGEDNGPLRVLPGTHTLGVLTDDSICRMASELTPINCVVPRGGVLAMRPLLLHSSSKSRTESPRRVLHIEYASSLNADDGVELAIA